MRTKSSGLDIAQFIRTPGLTSMDEWNWLKETATIVAARFGDATNLVNIGVAHGGSLHCLRAGAPNAHLIGIDISFVKRPIIGDPRAQLIEGRSQDVEIEGPAHLVFVDGSHHLKHLLGDIARWAPKVPVGGIVLFHDCAPIYTVREPKRIVWNPVETIKAVATWKQSPGWGSRWNELTQVDTIMSFERIS